jgi:hypothetical protein
MHQFLSFFRGLITGSGLATQDGVEHEADDNGAECGEKQECHVSGILKTRAGIDSNVYPRVDILSCETWIWLSHPLGTVGTGLNH